MLNHLTRLTTRGLLALLGAVAILLNFTLEALARHSPLEALAYLVESPHKFAVSTLIILFTLSLCLLTKRRLTLMSIAAFAWLALGVTNCVLLGIRSSPLSAIDFTVAKSALGMMTLYVSLWQILLLLLAGVGLIALIVRLHRVCPVSRVSLWRSSVCITLIGAVAITSVRLSANDGYGSGELREAYEENGFAYCFTQSLVSQGVRRPEGFTDAAVKQLIASLEAESAQSEGAVPNVIFVQLESFIDPERITWLECSSDPIPTFRAIRDSGASGRLSVSSVGGGTANTEFEVLTGMNLDHFGLGEYPYTTVLGSRSLESLATELGGVGLTAHALHNHTATFYSRHEVYGRLGFTSFTPLELMNGVTENPLGFARDEVLVGEIMSALESTSGRDFVFAVTVQGHGKYPTESLGGELTVSGAPTPELSAQLEYYVNQLAETDRFIADLVASLEACGEPVVLVLYGDHLPELGLSAAELSGGLYETEYAIWTNTSLFDTVCDLDLEAYRLSALVLGALGVSGGEISALHQRELSEGLSLDSELELLEYALLNSASDGENELSFGTRELAVVSAAEVGNTLVISGSGFTPYCQVRIGGFPLETEFTNSGELRVSNCYFSGDTVEVAWLARDGTVLAVRRAR